MLFVSVQQNNIELSIQCAINEYIILFLYCWGDLTLTFFSLIDCLWLSTVCPYHHNPNNCERLILIQERMTWYTMLWFGHSFVSGHSIYWTEYSLSVEQIPVSANTPFVSMCQLWKLSLVNIHSRKVSPEAEENKGYVKPIMILTCCSETHMWFRMWVPYWMTLKLRLMKCW